MSTQTRNYIHLHIHVHHIIQLPETQDPNSSFTTAPGSAALFDGAVGESPPADLSPGGASAPHWLGRAAPRDLLLQAEKAFGKWYEFTISAGSVDFSGHGLLLIRFRFGNFNTTCESIWGHEPKFEALLSSCWLNFMSSTESTRSPCCRPAWRDFLKELRI